MLAPVAVEAKLPGPFKPTAHPQPPRSIATAETLATPQLPVHLGAQQPGQPGAPQPGLLGAQPAVTQLGMPPGIPVAPGSSPAAAHTGDEDTGAFGAEHHADPAQVVALHQAEQGTSGVRDGRDVLAGWGWSTGSVEALDDDYADEAARRSRKHLMIAIGGALGVVIIIAIAAFAFSGSKKADDKGERGSAGPSPTAAIAAAPDPTPAPPPAQPAAPSPEKPADPTNTAAAPTNTAEPPKAETPAPAPAPPGPTNADAVKTQPPAAPVSGDPPKPGAIVPPRFDATKPEPARAEPARAEPDRTEPPRTEPVKPDPTKIAVAPRPAAPRAEPPKPEPARAVEKKPPEPKKPPEKAVKHPPAPERVAKANPRAQPVDPYAAPERPRLDPSAAYRTGLQQYAHGDNAGALATFRGSLSSNPGFAPTWRGLGLVYEKMGNKGQARAAFKRYLQLAPSAGDADQIRDRMERLGS
jgi:hypothetical protein